MGKKLTTLDFIIKSKAIYANAYSYEKTIYKGSQVALTLTCPVHGDFEVIPVKHTGPDQRACRGCSGYVPQIERITGEFLRKWYHYYPETGAMIVRATGRIIGKVGESSGYTETRVGLHTYGIHRLAYLYMTDILPEMVDHKNRIRHDNRWDNLRAVTNAQNQWNVKGLGICQEPQGFMIRRQIMKQNYTWGPYQTRNEAEDASKSITEDLFRQIEANAH